MNSGWKEKWAGFPSDRNKRGDRGNNEKLINKRDRMDDKTKPP